MAMRDTVTDLADLIYPLPEHPGDDADEATVDGWSEYRDAVQRDREEFTHHIRLAWENADDFDPLLAELAAARQAKLEAEQRIRLLIAYAREFVEPRPYRLDDLARAAGMSISGVRTAYDDEAIATAAQRTGARLRRREDPS